MRNHPFLPVTVCKTTCRALLSPSFSAENNKFIRQLLYFSTRAMVLHKICSIILVQGNLRGGRMYPILQLYTKCLNGHITVQPNEQK